MVESIHSSQISAVHHSFPVYMTKYYSEAGCYSYCSNLPSSNRSISLRRNNLSGSFLHTMKIEYILTLYCLHYSLLHCVLDHRSRCCPQNWIVSILVPQRQCHNFISKSRNGRGPPLLPLLWKMTDFFRQVKRSIRWSNDIVIIRWSIIIFQGWVYPC